MPFQPVAVPLTLGYGCVLVNNAYTVEAVHLVASVSNLVAAHSAVALSNLEAGAEKTNLENMAAEPGTELSDLLAFVAKVVCC